MERARLRVIVLALWVSATGAAGAGAGTGPFDAQLSGPALQRQRELDFVASSVRYLTEDARTDEAERSRVLGILTAGGFSIEQLASAVHGLTVPPGEASSVDRQTYVARAAVVRRLLAHARAVVPPLRRGEVTMTRVEGVGLFIEIDGRTYSGEEAKAMRPTISRRLRVTGRWDEIEARLSALERAIEPGERQDAEVPSALPDARRSGRPDDRTSAAVELVRAILGAAIRRSNDERDESELDLAEWLGLLDSPALGMPPDLVTRTMRRHPGLMRAAAADDEAGRQLLRTVVAITVSCHARAVATFAISTDATPASLPHPPTYPGRGGAIVGDMPVPTTNFDDPDEVAAHEAWEAELKRALALQARHQMLGRRVRDVETDLRSIFATLYASSGGRHHGSGSSTNWHDIQKFRAWIT